MVIDDDNLVLFEPGIVKEVLLAGSKVYEQFQAVIGGDQPHHDRLQLADEYRFHADLFTGKCLCEDCFTGDAIGVDVRYNSYLIMRRYQSGAGLHIFAKTHWYNLCFSR